MNKSIVFMALAIVLNTSLFAQTATVWRNGTDGVYPETGLLKSWPEGGPEVLWVFEGLGEGHSSPAFALNHIFVSTMIGQEGYIFVLDLEGKEVKRYPYGTEFYESYNGARSTPVIVGDWLYIYSGQGVIYAFEALTGKLRWKKDMLANTDGKNIQWGVTETVVVDAGLLYLSPGGKEQNIVALDSKTGEPVWTSAAKGELSAYCTPRLIEFEYRKLLVTMMASHIVGVDAETGEFLWSHYQPNQWSVHANTPVFSNGMLYCTSGYGQGTVALQLNEDGSSATQKWFNSSLDNRMGGTVLIDGYLYGSGDKSRGWYCVDAQSGEQKWSSKTPGNGVVIAADGMLFIYSDRGELVLASASPDAFEIKGQAKVTHGTAQHWAHPVINNGILYLRHGDALVAYKIK
ncbi:MAG TPA: PQQ-like beta-propeller repeat protein [Prolixibacteraceae bacterium]|nr:PQQ-like beta-propeller repeat protein [Prolixibacteraceae bacterium]HPR61337.1 PQQ-like beta-propeller repeat protein [Prolixibacteraceae bacterium]